MSDEAQPDLTPEEQAEVAQAQDMFQANYGKILAVTSWIREQRPEETHFVYLAGEESPFAKAVLEQLPEDAYDRGTNNEVIGVFQDQALVEMNMVEQEVLDEVLPQLTAQGLAPVLLVTVNGMQIAGVPADGGGEGGCGSGEEDCPDCDDDKA